MKIRRFSAFLFVFAIFNLALCGAEETLGPLSQEGPPQTMDGLWAGYDPRKEPLETEVLKEWEEEGVVLRIVRYRIGIFKGETARMAAIFGFPKGGENLPGLVNIHGGGQYADYKAVLTNAKRGYATVTIAWAGRISSPGYRVTPKEVKLFWDQKTDDPAYKLTTDWGALDAYHAPSKNGKDAFVSIPTAPWTIDSVESPRNNSWFLCTLGARRALTFLEQQPEVDGNRLGVYGHSMGGKLSVLTTGSDKRVKASAPSCGGISDRYNANRLHRDTVGDSPSLKNITCPVIFLSPANDFHGHINDLVVATEELKTKHWRVTCSAHINHRDLPENEVATQLWFDQHLKGTFSWPETPQASLKLKTDSGIPSFSVEPDLSKPVLGVEIYYTQQGIEGGSRQIRENRINRFWHHATATRNGNVWTGELSLSSVEKPLWVYANVLYSLDKPVTGAGYYYGTYTTDRFNLSSLIQLVNPDQLNAAGIKQTLQPTRMIESFEGNWKKEWFSHKPADWSIRTHKLYHPLWAAPEGAQLELKIRSEKANKLVLGLDACAAEIMLAGGGDWETLSLNPSDFKDANENAMTGWSGIKELRLLAAEHLRSTVRGDKTTRPVGANWKGKAPEFSNLQWRE